MGEVRPIWQRTPSDSFRYQRYSDQKREFIGIGSMIVRRMPNRQSSQNVYFIFYDLN